MIWQYSVRGSEVFKEILFLFYILTIDGEVTIIYDARLSRIRKTWSASLENTNKFLCKTFYPVQC